MWSGVDHGVMALTPTKSCPNCGAPCRPNASFCGRCGAVVRSGAPPQIGNSTLAPPPPPEPPYSRSLGQATYQSTPAPPPPPPPLPPPSPPPSSPASSQTSTPPRHPKTRVCLKCGWTNPNQMLRCQRCQSILPVRSSHGKRNAGKPSKLSKPSKTRRRRVAEKLVTGIVLVVIIVVIVIALQNAVNGPQIDSSTSKCTNGISQMTCFVVITDNNGFSGKSVTSVSINPGGAMQITGQTDGANGATVSCDISGVWDSGQSSITLTLTISDGTSISGSVPLS